MRRAILTILLYLMLGLVTSVAVAWVAAVGYQATDEHTRDYLLFGQLKRSGRLVEAAAVAPPNGGALKWWSSDDTWGALPRWSVLNEPPRKRNHVWSEFASGWPMLCLHSSAQQASRGQPPFEWDRRGRIEGRIELPWPKWDWGNVDHLPSQPIWLNLAVNATFWALVWLLLLSLPNLWRVNKSLRRRPKGRCGWCNYDLRKTPRDGVCPECGHEVSRPPRLLRMPPRVGPLVMTVLTASLTAGSVLLFASQNPVQAWHWAIYRGDTDVVRVALSNGADPNTPIAITVQQSMSPLSLAMAREQWETVVVLLRAGADPDRFGDSPLPLISAIQSQNHEIVRHLLDHGAFPDSFSSKGESALSLAVQADDAELVRMLLDAGADPSLGGRSPTPLHAAQSVEVIEMLLNSGADVNAGSGDWTPLFVIAQQNRPDLVEKLLEHRASISFSTIRITAYPERIENLKLLIQYGADLAQLDHNAMSIWHHVDTRGIARPVWELIYEHNPDVNALESRSISGMSTPLHGFAAQHDPPRELISFLLDHGADPRIANSNGRTAIDDATNDDVRQLLINAAQEMEDRPADEPDDDSP